MTPECLWTAPHHRIGEFNEMASTGCDESSEFAGQSLGFRASSFVLVKVFPDYQSLAAEICQATWVISKECLVGFDPD